ncbi:MAG: hypothetical protein QNJ69_10420 [Gammaproteobacteria bacterium]|nr:hypothetical protein [Gammaproteobacteria bacterium]
MTASVMLTVSGVREVSLSSPLRWPGLDHDVCPSRPREVKLVDQIGKGQTIGNVGIIG